MSYLNKSFVIFFFRFSKNLPPKSPVYCNLENQVFYIHKPMFRWFRRWIFRKSKKEYDKWFVWIWQINCLKPKIDRNIHLLDILAFLMLTTWKMRWNLIQNRPKFEFLYQCTWNMAYFDLILSRNLSRCRFGFTWYHLRKNKPKLPKNRSNLRWSRSEMQRFLKDKWLVRFLVLNSLFVIFK